MHDNIQKRLTSHLSHSSFVDILSISGYVLKTKGPTAIHDDIGVVYEYTRSALPNLEMNCGDLAAWQGITVVDPEKGARWHAR